MRETTKQLLQFMIVSFLLFSTLPYIVHAETEWTISDNTVYIDTPLVYASATPHTLGSDGWVIFNFTSKQYTGDIDFVWGFNLPSTTPHNPQIWTNYTHTLTSTRYKERTQTNYFSNITNYTQLDINDYNLYSVDFGNANNTYLYHIYDQFDDYIIAFSSFNLEEETTTSLYDSTEQYEYQSTFYDWYPLSLTFDVINYEHGGMNTWYLLKDTSIVSNKQYSIRAWIDIPFNGLNTSSGKYWWGFKPSSETIQQSIDNEHFYMLDPWWDSSWNYLCYLTIESDFLSTDVGPNIPILVPINGTLASYCNGGNSIRFLSTDNTTEFNYEIEYWDPTCVYTSYVWVNISEVVTGATDYTFLMYYNNSLAADNQNKPGTWNGNYRLVCHMNDTTNSAVTDSTANANHGTKDGANEPNQITGGVAHYCQDGDGTDDYINFGQGASINLTNTPSTLEVWVQKTWDFENRIICGDSRSDKAIGFYVYTGAGIELIVGTESSPRQIMNELYQNTTWNHIVVTYDASGCSNPTAYLNGQLLAEDANNNWGWAGDDFYAFKRPTGTLYDGYMDELRIISYQYNATEVLFHYHSGNKTTGFLTFNCGFTQPAVIPQIPTRLPENANTSICPCNSYFSVEILQVDSLGMNLTVYVNNTFNDTYVEVKNLTNITNGTYSWCMCEPVDMFNTTYNWYINVTLHMNSSVYNASTVYTFTTTIPENCSSSTTTDHISDETWILPVSVMFSIGYFMIMKKKPQKRRR